MCVCVCVCGGGALGGGSGRLTYKFLNTTINLMFLHYVNISVRVKDGLGTRFSVDISFKIFLSVRAL